MKFTLLAAVFTFAGVSASTAAVTVFNTQASFLAATTDPYLETFDSLISGPPSALVTLDFASAPYAYQATQSGTRFFTITNTPTVGDRWLSSNSVNTTITLTFANNNIFAVGGNFFATDNAGAFRSGGFQLQVNGESPEVINPTSANSFIGFVSDDPITTLTIAPTSFITYTTVNDFIVGGAASAEAIPEPASTMITATLLAAGLMARRREKAAA